ncbi:hypothetical protein P2H44_11350 [Albimonas sp. CAU 1670]|uniref:hypothetical protein n=1 Tax=Albimonas sp. CAU 1670 TaxID=3032599 RepID=UPI0023DB1D66|nr:hypothetical protein [Albimonas sp. CAU 1670]MDF2233147.1 hypothetical protein [Albimonas sp. CAU 1670]
MTGTPQSPMMTVRLRESTVALLLPLREGGDEALDAVVARIAKAAARVEPAPPLAPESQHVDTELPTDQSATQTASADMEPRPLPARRPAATPRRRHRRADEKYSLTMLGEEMHAATLGDMFLKVVDALHQVAPNAVERLAASPSRKRAFVSRRREIVHPGRPDLPVLRTTSGWWVSANIGTADLERALRAVCEAAKLEYGRDIQFHGQAD